MVEHVIILVSRVMEHITTGNVSPEKCTLAVQHATTLEDINQIRPVITAITMTTAANMFQ